MGKNTRIAIFYPRRDEDVGTYYDNITGHFLGAIGVKYGILGPVKNKLNTHNNAIPQVIKKAYDDNQVAQGSTEAKDAELRDAKFEILRELQRITKLDNWDEQDGETLGIRVEHTAPDPNTMQPEITGVTVLPDKVEIDWVKRGMQGVIIYGSYDGSSFTEIGRDGRSPYDDTRKNQTPGQAETRHYKFRYMEQDKPLGLDSKVVQVAVDID